MKSMPLHALFFASGISGLVYQVVWVRQFGQIFGNTVHSASIVVAIFMVGLGAGGYVFGAFADRRYQSRPESLVRVYGVLEVLIAALGLLISLLLPHLGALVAQLSSYESGPQGWQALSSASYLSRAAIAVALLTPITLLMGGTLTVLVRAVVSGNLHVAGWRVALLYGTNTLGAAIGAFLTDFVLIPRTGIFTAQVVAVALNLIAAAGAFALGRPARHVSRPSSQARSKRAVLIPPGTSATASASAPLWVALALAMSGFAALGMEMLWLRHLALLLGGFRAVFSLLLTVMLLALGAGALLGGWLDRRVGRPAQTLILVEALFAATALLGLASGNAATLAERGSALAASLGTVSSSSRVLTELWFNLRPMLFEVALPSLVGGLAFPLANAVVQRAEASVGRRAGALYAANTIGAVCGSLVTGYLLLPRIGMQGSAALLAGVAALTMVPLSLAEYGLPRRRVALVAASLVSVSALTFWFSLPPDYLVRRALGLRDPAERVIALSEGLTELVAVVERPGRGRGLLTNGHAMSSTAMLDQRYMRALAHIPLLAMDHPRRVLVIGFGVGNTAHAAVLHPSVTDVDIADLSAHILDHASYFRDANRDVLRDAKVNVFVNDGRQHLQMTAPGSYDLITLEPPPIAHAGVAALYSREFYQLARSRLTAGGYVSQWLPAYQVPAESSLAMVKSFLEVFPQAVLLSGAQAELLLIGTAAPRIELDPARVRNTLEREPSVQEDLARVDLGSVRDIAGAFVGSADTLVSATRGAAIVTDDRPVQEYGVLSGLSTGLMGVPSALFDVTGVFAWCPRCIEAPGEPGVPNLDLYLRLLQQAYLAPVRDVAKAASEAHDARRIRGSAYLGAVLPDSAEVHNLLGLALMRDDEVEAAIREFQRALERDPRSPNARANLGQIRLEQGSVLLQSRQYAGAAAMLREAVDLMPDSAEAHNDLGVALASMGRVSEAMVQFQRAVSLEPDFAEARKNLEQAAGS
jgi:predicted membrane-bound spermidine synthase